MLQKGGVVVFGSEEGASLEARSWGVQRSPGVAGLGLGDLGSPKTCRGTNTPRQVVVVLLQWWLIRAWNEIVKDRCQLSCLLKYITSCT